MKIAKKLLAMVVVLAMMLGLTSTTVFANNDVRVVVNGYEVQFEGQGAVFVNNRVLVPVRGVFDHLGFAVSWDSSARVATLTGDVTVVIPADGSHFYVNGEVVTPVVPQLMLNGRLLLPLAAVAEVVGATPSWDSATRVATITTVVGEDVPAPADDEDYDDNDDVVADDEDYDENDEDDADDEDYDENDEDDEDEDDEDEDDEQTDVNPLVGAWAWDANPAYWVYTFNADGTGTATIDGEVIDLVWSIEGDILTIIGDIYIQRIFEDGTYEEAYGELTWIFTIEDGVLTITSTIIEDQVWSYLLQQIL